MWNLVFLLCAAVCSTNCYNISAIDQRKAAKKPIGALSNVDILNSDRRSIYANWPAVQKKDKQKSFPSDPTNSRWNQQPFVKQEVQSQYLHPDSIYFRYLRRNAESAVQQQAETNMEKARDMSMKAKIAVIVETTIHDAEERMKSLLPLKDKYKDNNDFKIGFILIMIRKSRDVMNELFNVAVKHRDQWQALEQLKIFELILHTNADTSTLVQQLTELNAASKVTGEPNKVNVF